VPDQVLLTDEQVNWLVALVRAAEDTVRNASLPEEGSGDEMCSVRLKDLECLSALVCLPTIQKVWPLPPQEVNNG